MAKEMMIWHVNPSTDEGRCEICCKELATRVLTIGDRHEHRFCEECFKRFASLVMSTYREIHTVAKPFSADDESTPNG
jgi:hypothetical protein